MTHEIDDEDVVIAKILYGAPMTNIRMNEVYRTSRRVNGPPVVTRLG